ncbi:MAG: hypothetical protein KDK39_16085 [Leptospiraceae bacterium]|nr:hypothetical protein [Leptospiraceae bacterium]
MQLIQITPPATPGPFHWSRKLFHMIGLVIPFCFYWDIFAGWTNYADSTRVIGIYLLSLAALFILLLDLLRFASPAFNQLFFSLFGGLMKDEEKGRFNAVTPYLIACALLFLFCSREVVILCCFYLMIGDPVAAYVGSRIGRVRFWNQKSLEGMLAFVLAGLLVSIVFLYFHGLVAPHTFFDLYANDGSWHYDVLVIVLSGSILAGIMEFFSSIRLMGLWDDNLLVPLGGAIGMAIASALWFGGTEQHILFEYGRLFATGP